MNAAWPAATSLALVAASCATSTADVAVADTIAGVVVRADGSPADAWIVLRNAKGLLPTNYPEPCVTGPSGTFRYDRLVASETYDLDVVVKGYRSRRIGPITPGTTDLRVALPAWRTLTVRAVDPEGAPLVGAEVRLHVTEAFPQWNSTAADGTASFGMFDDVVGDLVARFRDRGATGRAKWVARRDAVHVSDGPVELVLGKGLTIEGRVLWDGPGDAPVPHLGVRAAPASLPERPLSDCPSAWTDDDGQFRIEGLEPGAYKLWRWYGDGGHGGSGPPQILLNAGEVIDAGTTGVVLRYGYARR